VTLLGRNGAGKTTTLKSVMGMVGRREGLDRLRGPRDRRAALQSRGAPGHRLLSEERGIFASLNVEENCCCRQGARGRLDTAQIFELFRT